MCETDNLVALLERENRNTFGAQDIMKFSCNVEIRGLARVATPWYLQEAPK